MDAGRVGLTVTIWYNITIKPRLGSGKHLKVVYGKAIVVTKVAPHLFSLLVLGNVVLGDASHTWGW